MEEKALKHHVYKLQSEPISGQKCPSDPHGCLHRPMQDIGPLPSLESACGIVFPHNKNWSKNVQETTQRRTVCSRPPVDQPLSPRRPQLQARASIKVGQYQLCVRHHSLLRLCGCDECCVMEVVSIVTQPSVRNLINFWFRASGKIMRCCSSHMISPRIEQQHDQEAKKCRSWQEGTWPHPHSALLQLRKMCAQGQGH